MPFTMSISASIAILIDLGNVSQKCLFIIRSFHCVLSDKPAWLLFWTPESPDTPYNDSHIITVILNSAFRQNTIITKKRSKKHVKNTLHVAKIERRFAHHTMETKFFVAYVYG